MPNINPAPSSTSQIGLFAELGEILDSSDPTSAYLAGEGPVAQSLEHRLLVEKVPSSVLSLSITTLC